MAATTDTQLIDSILNDGAANGASDVHFVAGRVPLFRINGVITEAQGFEVLNGELVKTLIYSLLTEQQQQKLESERELDFAYQSEQGVRFRVNIHWEKNHLGMVARIVPSRIPTMEEIRLPAVAAQLCQLKQGLILVTGPTGCGKSTTLATMIEHINQTRASHIVTLEDPIEYMFTGQKSVVRQRELYKDFLSFGRALKSVVRMDPDVIMVGEMRDLDTISAALTVAETGHLVLATLHTLGSSQTVDRIIDVFPPHQQNQIRLQLSMELKAVVSQQLLPSTSGGRVAAREVMINTPAIANLIRENKIPQIASVLQTSAEQNMMTFDQDIKALYEAQLITEEVALSYVSNPEYLNG